MSPHARLTHPDRPTLEFRGGQNSEASRSAQASITNELATERTPLVHTETREVDETEQGSTTGLRRASNDPNTSDPYQALANYAVELEAHVDEFQGASTDDGYTYENDQTGAAKSAVLESIEWSLSPGQRYELDFEAAIIVGKGTMESQDISPESVTVGAGFDAMLRLDGTELPGMRDYRVQTSIGIEPNPLFDRTTAENNDIVINEGRQRRVTFNGVHTGTRSERQNADNALENLLATKNNITLETQFPGYSIDGYLLNYNSTFGQATAFDNSVDGSHQYTVEFVEGERA